MRTCVGCRRVAAADELVRVVAEPGGGAALGRSRPGRGAWLCKGSSPCLEVAVARKALDRALRTTLTGDAVAGLRSILPGRGTIEG